MRIILQRVSTASVHINREEHARIERGFLILLGIEEEDGVADIDWLCRKLAGMRVFSDDEGKMNLSINDVRGQILVISQFTLHASTKKGNRPSFIRAARPERAIPLYEAFIKRLDELMTGEVKSGEFGAHMEIALINDGPVTISMDSKIKE